MSATTTTATATTSNTATFRTVQKGSNSDNLRANVLLLESILLYLIYIYYNHQQRDGYDYERVVQIQIQNYLLDIFCIIYFIRLNYMARYLLPRELAIEEITVVPFLWLSSIMASFLMLKQQSSTTIQQQIIVSTLLYIVGSYLNTYSELERKNWKLIPSNKGKCYMDGLFAYSRNINYFGDTVLFGGWAYLTGSIWNIWVPIVMASTFWFYHIPDKELYLQNKYKKEWLTYKQQTPYAFIPFIC